MDVLIESCPTKIFLPNEEANVTGTAQNPGPRDFYRALGLNETQIEIIRCATKKKHYYLMSPEGRRLFDLGLGPITLAFASVMLILAAMLGCLIPARHAMRVDPMVALRHE